MLMLCIALPHAYAMAGIQATYYVDPINGNDTTNSGTSIGSAFKTIAKARDVVRTINSNMTGDIYVYLRGGTYWLTSTLTFTDSDAGTNGYNIIYTAYNNEKPIISGGKQITGWSLCDSCQNIYRAYAGGNIETRQLYVNGVRATRARSTVAPSPLTFVAATGYTATGSIFVNSALPMDQWKNQHDIEFVYNVVFTAPREEVDSITYSGSTTTFTMKQPGWYYVTNRGGTSLSQSYLPWYVENAYELLDAEGEWYLDRSVDSFYYKPKAGEYINTAQVIAPVVEQLVTITGSDAVHKAGYLQFYGITFRHATWVRPNTYGQCDAQNNVRREAGVGEQIINAAIQLKNAHFVRFERDVFEKLGGSGLNMYAGCQDNVIVGSRFTDISGEGIQVGDYLNYGTAGTENYALTTDTTLVLRNNDISNNYLNNCGAEYFSASGIGTSFPVDMDITHNEVGNMPYTGIHIGWGWGVVGTNIKNVKVQSNYIHELNSLLNDGGGIYTNGKTSGSPTLKAGYFQENYIVNVQHGNGYAMYNDEASNGNTYYQWNKNVINTAAQYAFQWRNNYNSWDSTYTNVSAKTVGGTNTVTNTFLFSGTWPDTAQRIIDSAGIQLPYQDIKPVTLPSSVFFEIFDWMIYGGVPSGWAVNNAGGDGTVTVGGDANATDKNMALVKTGTVSGQDLASSHGFTALYSGIVQVKAQAGQTNALALPIALKSGSTTAIEIAFNSNGQIAYKDASANWVNVQAYTAATWYNFKVEFDAVTDTYNFYVDTVKKLSNQPFAVSSDALDTIVQTIKSASAGTMNVDSVKVYPGYSSSGNVALGKTITGFSSQLTTTMWAAANINDGTVGDVNSNQRGWASVSGSGTRNEWVKMDLGQTYALTSLTIQNEDGANRNVKDYVLYGSATGAFTGEEYVITSGTIPSLSNFGTYKATFTSTDARYIKFKGTSSYSNWVIVGEMGLYGTPDTLAPTNAALNKTVTGFSSQFDSTDWKATNINDGTVGSVTSLQRGWASVSGTGTRNEWVTIDLGQNYTLSSFIIQNEDGANRNVKDYVLYGSSTGAFAGEEYIISSGTIPSLSNLASYKVAFTAKDARYIKFKATSSYSSYVIVGELSLFGVPAPTPTVVSLNKTVTGYSSQYDATSWKATNINDGTVGGITSSTRGWASVTGTGTRNEWVSIDLGQTYTMSSFIIQNEDGAGRNVKDYTLYGSSTGAFAGEEFVISSGTIPSLSALATYTVGFSPARARYVKFKGSSSYSSYVIVGELSLYGY